MKLLAEDVLYRKYQEFFETAERKRRWSVFDDLPWDLAENTVHNASLALCAETFCAVESFLPDYVACGLNLVRESFGQAWWQINWGYEEAKHALALREYLVETGQRTRQHMLDFETSTLKRKWQLPFSTPRQMVCYGALQEKATWMIYQKQKVAANAAGDTLLAAVYQRIARDEAAHGAFYQDVLALCVEEDRAGSLDDLALVVRGFTMPAYDLLDDYDERVAVMRTAGVDSAAFLAEVVLPILRRIGSGRRELLSQPSFRNRTAAAAVLT
jgi:acyl-[acyl-carrier-protein] desaturase